MATDAGFLEIPYGVSVFLVVACAVGSAMFSGLTLGLLTLDCVQLKLIIEQADKNKADEHRARLAKRVMRIRKDGNYLLVTLLMGNVAVNSGFTILMGELVSALAAFLISTVVITLFGEIVPQAVCARHGLVIGGYLSPGVMLMEWILFPVVKPIAVALNCILGEEIGGLYSKKQLKALVDHHQTEAHILTKDEARIIHGGLDFAMKSVEQVMTPIDKVFGLNIESKLDYESAAEMLRAGYSRIPVFDYSKKQCIVGLLFVRDLVLMDPDSDTSIRSAVAMLGRKVYAVDNDTTLLSLLTDFKKGHTHLAVVRRVVTDTEFDPYYEHVGIITLEDIIEEIIQDEIYDEAEACLKEDTTSKKSHPERATSLHIRSHKWKAAGSASQEGLGALDGSSEDVDVNATLMLGRIRLLDRRRGVKQLDDAEAVAVALFLGGTDPAFVWLKGPSLPQLLKTVGVKTMQSGDILYTEGCHSDVATVLLQGKVKVVCGRENFVSNLGPWSTLGMKALHAVSRSEFNRVADLMSNHQETEATHALQEAIDVTYIPDYTATVIERNSRVVRISQQDYLRALKAASLFSRHPTPPTSPSLFVAPSTPPGGFQLPKPPAGTKTETGNNTPTVTSTGHEGLSLVPVEIESQNHGAAANPGRDKLASDMNDCDAVSIDVQIQVDK
eukprot:GHVQ01001033.1.p1 GENE.GHVQ01001033.1~~GHVQ01001033.1.p1  ORF type:complete len:670 (-),score=84.04 GHVQ01001033.1:1562-3571(-)